MLLIYAAIGAFILSLGAYVYGSALENGRREDRTRMETLDRNLASSLVTHSRETWELVLFDCDFGASSQTHGPGRTLFLPKRNQPRFNGT